MPTNNKSSLKPDTVLRDFWKQKDVFADFFNAYLFGGKEVIRAEGLVEKDTDSSAVLSINDTTVTIQGARDNLQTAMIYENVEYAILGIEDEESINYAIPFKIERYDVIAYDRQYKKLKKHYEDTKELRGSELISGIKKSDRFTPVVTVVVYFGRDPWDGPTCLYDILNIPEELKPFVNNFKVNIVEVRDNDLVFHNQNNRDLFTLLKIIYDKTIDHKTKRAKLAQYEAEHTIEASVCKVIASTSKITMDIFEKKGDDVKLVTIWDEVREDGKVEGRAEGRIEGRAEGRIEGRTEGIPQGENKLASLINKLIMDNRQDDILKATNDVSIRNQLYKKYGIS